MKTTSLNRRKLVCATSGFVLLAAAAFPFSASAFSPKQGAGFVTAQKPIPAAGADNAPSWHVRPGMCLIPRQEQIDRSPGRTAPSYRQKPGLG